MTYRYHRSGHGTGRGTALKGSGRAVSGRRASHRRIGPRPGERGRRWGAGAGLVLGIAAVLTGLAGGVDVLMHSGWFEVREVRASGLERLSRSDVLGPLQAVRGANLYDLNLGALQRRLLAEPWIREVNLRKDYPDTLSIYLTERRPAAVLEDGGLRWLVDDTGTLIEQWAGNDPDLDGRWGELPVMTGIPITGLQRGEAGALARIHRFMSVLQAAPFARFDGLRADLSKPAEVRLLRDGVWLRFGEGPYEKDWSLFSAVEEKIRPGPKAAGEVDLRFAGQVIVR